MEPSDLKSPLPPRRVEVEENETPVVAEQPTVSEIKMAPKKESPTKWLIAVGVVIGVIVLGILLIRRLGAKKQPNAMTTINYWGLWEEESVMGGIIADFEAKNPKIKINYIKNQKDNYRTRLQAKLAKTSTDTSAPDIFRIHNSWLPMFKGDLAKVPAETSKSLELETDFFDVYKQDLRTGGGYLAIPLMYDGLALFYNKDILEAADIRPPRTWWGLQQAAEKLTKRNEAGRIQVAGAAMGTTGNVDHWSDIIGLMLKQNGVNVLKNDAENNKKLEGILTYYTHFRQSYKVWDESLPPSTLAFAHGKLAFYLGPSWRIFDIEAINPNLKYEITSAPQLPTLENAPYDKIENEGLTDYLTNIHWASYWVEGVNNKSQKQKEAWKFLEFLASGEGLEKMYAAASQLRNFGEIYPRKSLGEKLNNSPKLKPFVSTANSASGWYLASRTFDDGLNEAMIGYFNDAINGMLTKNLEAEGVVDDLKKGIEQVAEKYQL